MQRASDDRKVSWMKTRGTASPPALEDLVTATRGGDAEAGEKLYSMARGKLAGMALALGVSRDDVPDLVQEVLVAAWRNLGSFDSERGTFLAWLAPGLRGRATNGFRGLRRRRNLLTRFWSSRSPLSRRQEEPHAALDARMTVARLVGALTHRQREVVALYELGELSSEETAKVLGIGSAAVRSIARDARARLREESVRMSRRKLTGRPEVEQAEPRKQNEEGAENE